MNRRTVRHIAFIKLCCVGDILFMTPALRATRAAYPDARITFIASRWVEDVVRRIPFVDDLLLYDPPYRTGITPAVLAKAGQLGLLLRKGKFDMILIGHRNAVFAFLSSLGGIPERVGFAGTRYLTRTVPFDETEHEVERYLALAAAVEATPLGKQTEIAALEEDIRFAERFFQRHHVEREKGIVGIFPGGGENPGTSMPIKRWYPEQYADCIDRLHREAGLTPLLLGGPQDRALIDELSSRIPSHIPVIDGANNSLGEYCGIVRECAVVIGGDSGPVHLAAALGIPTVTIFGPSDPRLVATRGERHAFVWKKPDCAPCYTPGSVQDSRSFRGTTFPCRTGTHECLRALDPEEVTGVVLELLSTIRLRST